MANEVEDILKLVDGLRERGVTRFQGAGYTFEIGRSAKPRRGKLIPDKEPENAVDLALELNSRKRKSDNDDTD